jgi:HlyD family secretion protein
MRQQLDRCRARPQSVSADSLLDEISGVKYYLARIEVTEEELARLGEGVKISSGMPVEIYIVTGERTLMQYILKPLTDNLRRSFRET